METEQMIQQIIPTYDMNIFTFGFDMSLVSGHFILNQNEQHRIHYHPVE